MHWRRRKEGKVNCAEEEMVKKEQMVWSKPWHRQSLFAIERIWFVQLNQMFRYYDIGMANTAFPLANTTSFRILETIWIEMVHVWIKKYGKFKVMQAEHFVERLDANRPNFDWMSSHPSVPLNANLESWSSPNFFHTPRQNGKKESFLAAVEGKEGSLKVAGLRLIRSIRRTFSRH